MRTWNRRQRALCLLLLTAVILLAVTVSGALLTDRATAADFSLPEGLDLDHPQLRETADVFLEVREDWCRAICQAVDRQMEENVKS